MRSQAGYTVGDMKLAQDRTAGEWVEEKIHEIFLSLADMVADEVFELDHPAPLIRGSIFLTNSWKEYLASIDDAYDKSTQRKE